MSNWKPRQRKWLWRDFLTPIERKIVEKADAARAEIEALTEKHRPLIAERDRITNRAIQRAKARAALEDTP